MVKEVEDGRGEEVDEEEESVGRSLIPSKCRKTDACIRRVWVSVAFSVITGSNSKQ